MMELKNIWKDKNWMLFFSGYALISMKGFYNPINIVTFVSAEKYKLRTNGT